MIVVCMPVNQQLCPSFAKGLKHKYNSIFTELYF